MNEYEINLPLPITTSNNTTDLNNITIYQPNSLKILYLNARSIKNKQEELQHIINAYKSETHIIAITET